MEPADKRVRVRPEWENDSHGPLEKSRLAKLAGEDALALEFFDQWWMSRRAFNTDTNRNQLITDDEQLPVMTAEVANALNGMALRARRYIEHPVAANPNLHGGAAMITQITNGVYQSIDQGVKALQRASLQQHRPWTKEE